MGGASFTKFSGLLHDCRLSKADLAKELRVHPGTVSHWGDDPPYYVVAFLEERKERLRLQEVLIRETVKARTELK